MAQVHHATRRYCSAERVSVGAARSGADVVLRSICVPSEIPGIHPNIGAGIPTPSPLGKVSPSRALVPVAPSDPRPVGAPAGSPLGRSGLDLAELLGTLDTVATRGRTPSVALEVGLEQARGALLRNLGSDALAALDSVWEGARRTEEGWYLRSGALTVLGLPGESDRVAEEGLAARPASAGLRFLQSLARLAVGDLAGARVALQPALDRAPHDPLLVVQQAVLLARQGDARGAEALLQRALRSAPDHPAVEYGRAAVRAATADATRSVSRFTPEMVEVFPTPSESFAFEMNAARAEGTARAENSPHASDEVAGTSSAPTTSGDGTRDVVDSALIGIGARLVSGAASDVARETRLLLRAFSAGGTLATAGGPEQAHAARALLTTLVSVLTGEHSEAPQPLRTLMQQLVVAFRDGRDGDADRLMRRASAVMREPTVRMMQLLVRGALGELARTGRGSERPVVNTPASAAAVVRGAVEPGVIVPVRLGLALLEETAASRSLSRATDPAGWATVSAGIDGRGVPIVRGEEVTGSYLTVPSADDVTRGWSAAELTAGARRSVADDDMRAGSGVRAVALVCVALAGAAMTTGHSAIAIALGVGAAWLALRRSSGEGRIRRSQDETELRQADRHWNDHSGDGRR